MAVSGPAAPPGRNSMLSSGRLTRRRKPPPWPATTIRVSSPCQKWFSGHPVYRRITLRCFRDGPMRRPLPAVCGCAAVSLAMVLDHCTAKKLASSRELTQIFEATIWLLPDIDGNVIGLRRSRSAPAAADIPGEQRGKFRVTSGRRASRLVRSSGSRRGRRVAPRANPWAAAALSVGPSQPPEPGKGPASSDRGGWRISLQWSDGRSPRAAASPPVLQGGQDADAVFSARWAYRGAR